MPTPEIQRFLGPPSALTAGKVRLEPLRLSEAEALFAVVRDPALWAFTPQLAPARVEDLRASLLPAAGEAWRFARVARTWAIRDVASGEVAGMTSLLDVRPENRGVEVGFTMMAPSFQRTGHNRSAKLALLRHCFADLGVKRVTFKTDARNAVSRRAIARLGAQEEGTLRAHLLMPDGYWRDSVYFSILAEEWPAVARELERQAAR